MKIAVPKCQKQTDLSESLLKCSPLTNCYRKFLPRKKWSRFLSCEYIFSSTDVKNVSINAHIHTPSQPAGLLGKKVTFYSFVYLKLLHYLIFSLRFLIPSITSHLRHRQYKIKRYFVISCLIKTRYTTRFYLHLLRMSVKSYEIHTQS